jgi:hypothetical protein
MALAMTDALHLQMLRFMSRCPTTGFVAKGAVPSDKEGKAPRYRLIRYTVCRGIHFVDPTTGEVIAATTNSDDDDQSKNNPT